MLQWPMSVHTRYMWVQRRLLRLLRAMRMRRGRTDADTGQSCTYGCCAGGRKRILLRWYRQRSTIAQYSDQSHGHGHECHPAEVVAEQRGRDVRASIQHVAASLALDSADSAAGTPTPTLSQLIFAAITHDGSFLPWSASASRARVELGLRLILLLPRFGRRAAIASQYELAAFAFWLAGAFSCC